MSNWSPQESGLGLFLEKGEATIEDLAMNFPYFVRSLATYVFHPRRRERRVEKKPIINLNHSSKLPKRTYYLFFADVYILLSNVDSSRIETRTRNGTFFDAK